MELDPCEHRALWEERYGADPENWFFGKDPSALARLTLSYWRMVRGEETARVLDLGCGEGRDAVFFAQQGFEVTAVDIAPAGLAKTQRLAREQGVGLARVECCDIRDFDLAQGYDLVFAANSLSALGEECLPTLRRLRQATLDGGLNVVRVRTAEAAPDEEAVRLYRFDRNELKLEYRGWRLLYYGEDLLWVRHMERLASFADVIAQKP